ncbi:hypothetical protein HNV08_05315 [Winogradskyella eckloniae]|uniref:hypothetical protein n=1 Tax=Winogradskyella eckloniae TaxID=1089306 RepID=UPI0015673701|nr:hypothetical protein [Winogradskyella eckloniae]NRD19458.1 hypothetical protein [Winogradskyella eckloniae]
MKNINNLFKYLFLFTVLIANIGCEEEEYVTAPMAISFENSEDATELDTGDTYLLKIETTAVSSVDQVFNIEVLEETADGTVATTASPDTYSFNSQVTIPAGELSGSTELTFNLDDLDFVDPQLVVFGLVDGDYTKVSGKTETVFEFARVCPLNLVSLNITTDDWPDETTYELYDLTSGQVLIASGGPFDLDFTTITTQFCLDSGDYGVIVYDSYGDGLVGDGFTVTLDGTILASGIVGPSADPGNVSSSGSATFTIN